MAVSLPSTAERLLAETFGGAVRLGAGEPLQEREHVTRFAVLEAPASAPASVIAKRPRLREGQVYDPESADPTSPAASLFDDWAGLQFLSVVMGAASPAPRFYAGDRAVGLFLMEDLGQGVNPADILLGADAPAAENFLLDMAAALGQLHARTTAHADEFTQMRGALGPYDVSPLQKRYRAWWGEFEKMLAGLRLTPRPGALADMDRILAAVADPGLFRAYTHGDPCPDNWTLVGDRLRLFDWENGRFRHALRDGVYGRMLFPTCWCMNRLPADLPERMEAAYRAELAQGCPAAADDTLFYQAVVEMCGFWTLGVCAGWPRKKVAELIEADGPWGQATLRQRVLVRTEIFAQLTAQFGHLEALGATIGQVGAHLRALWPVEAESLPVYPAFRV